MCGAVCFRDLEEIPKLLSVDQIYHHEQLMGLNMLPHVSSVSQCKHQTQLQLKASIY